MRVRHRCFQNSAEKRRKSKHSLGRVFRHSLVSCRSPDGILICQYSVICRALQLRVAPLLVPVCSTHREVLCRPPRTRGQSPQPRDGSPRSGCKPQTAAQLPGSVFPMSGTDSSTTDTTSPVKREALAVMPEARRSPQTQPGGGRVWCLGGPWGDRIHHRHSALRTAAWKPERYVL